jgi:uncharacterized membrane protein YczE
MTGLHRKTNLPIGVVRTALEVVVVAIGFALGGVVGIGTILYTLSIGPLVQLMLPRFIVELPEHGFETARSSPPQPPAD